MLPTKYFQNRPIYLNCIFHAREVLINMKHNEMKSDLLRCGSAVRCGKIVVRHCSGILFGV